jgi:predicted nucleotidyltransferase
MNTTLSDENLLLAIERTWEYGKIFEYVPNQLETRRYLIQHKEPRRDVFNTVDFPAPSEQQRLRVKTSWEFIRFAQFYAAKFFQTIPWITLIAISGSTAALNSTKQSDIDLLIVCQKNTRWLVRLIVLIILKFSNRRVDLNVRDAHDRVRFCPNMIIESDALLFPNRDLYTAMELSHLKIVINKNRTFERLITANKWMAEFLPNYWHLVAIEWGLHELSYQPEKNTFFLIKQLNRLSKLLQKKFYYKKNQRELTLINDWIIDHRHEVLRNYHERTKRS